MIPGSKSCNSVCAEGYVSPDRDMTKNLKIVAGFKLDLLFCCEAPLTTYVLAAIDAWTAGDTAL